MEVDLFSEYLEDNPKRILVELSGRMIVIQWELKVEPNGCQLVERDIGSDDGFLYVWCKNREHGSYLACWHAFLGDTYSASVVDMANAVCFLEKHDVRKHPMKDAERLTSTSKVTTGKVGQEHGKMPSVEPFVPVPAEREPASAEEGN
uniref:Uncharacterized protein n=1 Tax=Tanacetum cinerariifolium TaxID=118510 RepID=A0A6L2N409_TANCI|nr:hypothetical protein [Tanacetum cinerariifolium]